MNHYTVLVSLDDGTTWVRHGPYQAASGDAAINQLRDEHPDLSKREVTHEEQAADPRERATIPAPQYFATTRFDPVVNERELVARWSLKRLSDREPDQAELEGT